MAIMDRNVATGAALDPDKIDPMKLSRIRLFDDFFDYVDGDLWDVTADSGGAQAAIDGAGGVLSIKCDGDDNDEAYVASSFESWLFTTNKKLRFKARVKCTEAATDDANLVAGLSSVIGADFLVDDAGGPAATYDGAVFFKVDGGTVWQTETSNAGTQVTSTSVGAFTSATWTILEIEYDPNDDVTAKVSFSIDGAGVSVHDLTISGLEEMHLILGVKAGGAAEETLLVDYVSVEMER